MHNEAVFPQIATACLVPTRKKKAALMEQSGLSLSQLSIKTLF